MRGLWNLWKPSAPRTLCTVGVELDEDVARLAIVYDADNVAACLEAPVADLASEVAAAGLTGAPCNIVLSPRDVMVMQAPRPNVPDEEVDEALRWSIKDSIDYAIDDAVIDHFDVPEDAIRGNARVSNVVIAQRSKLAEELDLLRSAGLDIHAIDIPELALRNVLSRYMEEGHTIGLLLIEEDRSIILLFKDDLLYLSRSLPCDPAIASANYDQRALDNLCLEVQRSQDYLESQLGQPPLQRLLVSAGEVTDVLAADIDASLGLEVAGISLTQLGAAADAVDTPAMLRAFGAALREVSA